MLINYFFYLVFLCLTYSLNLKTKLIENSGNCGPQQAIIGFFCFMLIVCHTHYRQYF